MHIRLESVAIAAAALLTACNLDLDNPNAPTEEATLTSPDGVIAVAIGAQARYGQSTGDFIYSSGLVTDELAAISAALVTISDAEQGVVGPGAGFAANVWNGSYRTVKSANDLINSVDGVTLDPGTRSGILAMAYVLKAAALGEVLQSFQQLPIDTYRTTQPTFVTREVALDAILALLDSAETTLDAQAPSTQFNSSIIAPGFDLRNTLYAVRARYARLADDWTTALAAANAVSRTVFSTLPFSTANVNPVFNLSSGSSGALPRDEFRLAGGALEAARVASHVTAAAITGRIETPLDNYARFTSAAATIPTYYPDEALLIKAEALLELNQLPAAQAALDSVRTDCPGLVATDPNACLAPLAAPLTAAELRAEIYRNRRFELFATGLRWEDTRRLGQVGRLFAGKRCWLLYTIGERNANPNVPVDPETTEPPTGPTSCGV
jgi:hypothetical protein